MCLLPEFKKFKFIRKFGTLHGTRKKTRLRFYSNSLNSRETTSSKKDLPERRMMAAGVPNSRTKGLPVGGLSSFSSLVTSPAIHSAATGGGGLCEGSRRRGVRCSSAGRQQGGGKVAGKFLTAHPEERPRLSQAARWVSSQECGNV